MISTADKNELPPTTMTNMFTQHFGRQLTAGLVFFGCLLAWNKYAIADNAFQQSIRQCFQHAQSAYEQIYCEIKARGEGKQLPPLWQFRNNNEMTQGLLLQRDAKRLGIRLPKRAVLAESAPEFEAQAITSQRSNANPVDCSYHGAKLRCAGREYLLVGNKANRELSKGALGNDNLLNLQTFKGKPLSDQAQLISYLTENYLLYLEGMLRIGLGGVSMSFTRFHYLFHDLSSKGLSFEQRFEQMYSYLKQDKARNAISGTTEALPDISVNECMVLSERIAVCDNVARNRIYVAQN